MPEPYSPEETPRNPDYLVDPNFKPDARQELRDRMRVGRIEEDYPSREKRLRIKTADIPTWLQRWRDGGRDHSRGTLEERR